MFVCYIVNRERRDESGRANMIKEITNMIASAISNTDEAPCL